MKKLLYIILFAPVALFGQDNYSLSFDGVDDYVDVVNDDNFKIETQLTLSAWFKTSQLINQRIVSNTSCGNKFFLMVDQGGGVDDQCHLKFNINCSSYPMCYDSTLGGEVCSNIELNDNDWHYLVGTWDGNVMRMYLDGVLLDEISGVIGPISYCDETQMLIGTRGSSEYFNGYIDLVQVIRG